MNVIAQSSVSGILIGGVQLQWPLGFPWKNPLIRQPLKGICAAVTRQTLNGYPEGERWNPKQCIAIEEAVWCYTMGSAIASGKSHFKGSITPEKGTNMVVLSKDIFQNEPSAILETHVDMTIFEGRIV